MTCRGSRFADGAKRNPNGEVFMKNRETDEWLAQNQRSTRNFIRKWGHFVKHDEYLKPIVPPKYDIGFVVNMRGNTDMLYHIEPWCSTLYVDVNFDEYIKSEQPNTEFDLTKRIYSIDSEKQNDIIVKFDLADITNHNWEILKELSEVLANDDILAEDGSGEFNLDVFRITINNLQTYEEELIKCER
jgi:hypothetical protein